MSDYVAAGAFWFQKNGLHVFGSPILGKKQNLTWERYARPLPRVFVIFLFAIEYSVKAQHTTTGAHAPGVAPRRAPLLWCVEPWLNTQWQTEA